ncbi:MAG: AAA domain-containing protein [Gemmatimonadetes bacterium]|nr:AAA domain-containing protein [Gemmatimonadota bacterium]MYK52678.1 AAA domain-containing protein [Gemmatimonadota bacterium]
MIKPLNRTGTWRTYSIADGLAGMRIEHIVEDSEGYLWFATWDNGVSRFDGDEFRNFTRRDGLVNDRVYCVSQDSQNRLWFGTLNGVCWYDGTNFHHLEDDGIAGRAVQFIYEDSEGRIWCGGHRTLGYYDGTVFHDLIPLYLQHYEEPPSPQWPKQCRGIAQDPEGQIWFGFDYLIRFDGISFRRYEKKEGFPQSKTSYALGQDSAGKVWFGQRGHQNDLWCYTDGTFQAMQVNLGGGLRKIQSDGTGRMWLCTSEGVLYQDGDGFNRFTPADGLPHRAVKAVFQDREHQYWFATWGGIALYDAHSISVFGLSGESSNRVSEISQIVQDSRGDIWVGSVSPVFNSLSKSGFRFNGEAFVCVGTEDGFDINNCFAIYEDHDGCLWFGGINGLFRYDGQKVEKIETIADLDGKSVSAIAQDSQGGFLFGHWENEKEKSKRSLLVSALKLVYQRGEQFQTIFEDNEKKDSFSRIGTVIPGRNREVYFFLTCHNFSGKGLAHWHPEDKLKFYGVGDGLIDDRVTDLLLDRDGNLWIATQGGLACFDGRVFHNFTTADGLPSNRIHCLLEDRKGHLWLGTDGGVAHYDGQHFQMINSPHIGPVSQILEDRDGNFWFGTVQNSLVRYRQQKNPPQICLLQVIADQIYENLQEDIVSTAGQQVVFEYKGLSFSTHPRDMLYIYRLRGYDSDWQSATRKMRAHYQDLSPGDYTFQVRAIDRDLNYSEIAQVQLSVEKDPRISALTSIINNTDGIGKEFIGQSTALHEFQIQLRKVASTDLTVLFKGETGVGKGLAARALHALSAHRDGPFMQVNCGALPETLIDSELFGHEKGAFTSAVVRRLGKVELAKGGTLFLDEVGDMTLETQTRMLRLLDEGTFERIGSSETLEARTRIVAATNRDLEEMISAGTFREDLYYRLNTFPIYLPPLRERKEDIPDLSEFFKNRMAAHIGKQFAPLTSEVIEVLQSYDWPGNVRELEHTIQRAVTVCNGLQIEVGDLGLYDSQIKGTVQDLKRRTLPDQAGEIMPLDEFERDYILKVLKATKWKIKGANGAATLLGLPPSTLYTKMKKLGIKRL